jgi:hypothetical protein
MHTHFFWCPGWTHACIMYTVLDIVLHVLSCIHNQKKSHVKISMRIFAYQHYQLYNIIYIYYMVLSFAFCYAYQHYHMCIYICMVLSYIYMHSVYIMNISLMLMWHLGWNIQAGFPPVSSILPVASRRSISPIRYAIEAKWSVCPFAKQRKIPEQNGCYVWSFCIAILPSLSKWATQNIIPEKRQQTRSQLYIFVKYCIILS